MYVLYADKATHGILCIPHSYCNTHLVGYVVSLQVGIGGWVIHLTADILAVLNILHTYTTNWLNLEIVICNPIDMYTIYWGKNWLKFESQTFQYGLFMKILA